MSLRSLLEELRDFDSALLANTIGYIDPTPPEELYMDGSIQSVTPSLGPTVGVAVTCECDSSTPGNKADTAVYWQTLEVVEKMDVPAVWVVRCVGSRPGHECLLGDGMAKALYAAGCVGAVTNGGVRDVAGLLTTPFAAYCRGTTIHHCALRFGRLNEPVEVGGLGIRPGDIIHASAEGVIRVPKSCLEILPARAAQMRAFEHDAHRVLRRTDMTAAQKGVEVGKLLGQYGFGDCVSQGKRELKK